MNYSEDQLRELELWPLLSWQSPSPAITARIAQDSAPQPRPAEPIQLPRQTGQNQEVTARPALADTPTPTARVSGSSRTAASGLGKADWSQLQDQVANCQACGLCKARKQTVFGIGVQAGPWMFVGEGPGAEEDEHGEPFIGPAGKLLDAMLASIQVSRSGNAYIANVVKCRPPGNRTPTPDEAGACAEYLDRQIDLVNPRLIVALGKTAAIRLTGAGGADASLSSMRGKVHHYRGFPVLVTYHPAYLLRNLVDKAKAWEDLVQARRIFAEQARQDSRG